MTPDEYDTLQAHEVHEHQSPSSQEIVITPRWYGKVLECEGFYLSVGPIGEGWDVCFQTRSRRIETDHDIVICQALLQRAREIMGGA